MKKFVFTALAVVAFSGVAMASTVAVDEVGDECRQKAAQHTDEQDPDNNNSAEVNHANYTSYYQGCEDAQQNPSLVEG